MSAGRPAGQVAAVGVVLLAAVGAVTGAAVARAEMVGPSAPVQVWRVEQSHCANGRIRQGIDTGRADGLLLAKDTGLPC